MNMTVTLCSESFPICTEHNTYQFVKLMAVYEGPNLPDMVLPHHFEVITGETGIVKETLNFSSLHDAIERFDSICKPLG